MVDRGDALIGRQRELDALGEWLGTVRHGDRVAGWSLRLDGSQRPDCLLPQAVLTSSWVSMVRPQGFEP